MKILIIGDSHFKLDLPYSSYFEDGRRGEWNDVKNKIHETARGCNVVILMGDNLNSKNNHSAVNAEFVSFLKDFGDKQIHLLVGNHERSGNITALDFLKNFNHPNWKVHKEPTLAPLLDGGSLRGMFVPYLTPSMVVAKDKEEGVEKALAILDTSDVAFFHQGITGASVHGQLVDLFNEIVLPKERLELLSSKIFTGHIHDHQELSEKTTLTGSLFTSEVGEEKKYIFVYDTDTKLTEKIELPERGIYKVTLPSDTLKVNNIPSNSIVKCYIIDRQVNIDEVREMLSRFDAHILIEQYPNERAKMYFEDGALDLSLDNILKIYSEAKDIDHGALLRGMSMLK